MIEIKKVAIAEHAEWARLRHKLWPEASVEAHRADIDKTGATPAARAWIAWRDGQPVGFAEAYLRPFANGCEGKPVVFLEGIWIEESLRRQGVAGRLVTEVEGWARTLGLKEIGSDTLIDEGSAQEAHRGWGFEEVERVVHFRKALR